MSSSAIFPRPSTKRTFATTITKCPSCQRSVYAAEQALGPGATPYHKTCLRCTRCRKVLDPFSILEHGYDPYCKICHSKAFGTKGLPYGNPVLPHCSSSTASDPISPSLPAIFSPTRPSYHLTPEEPCPPPSISPVGTTSEPIYHHPSPPPSQPTIDPERRATSEAASEHFQPLSPSSLKITIKPRPTPSQPPRENSLSAQLERGSVRASTLQLASHNKHPLTPPPKPSKPLLPPVARAASSSPYIPRPIGLGLDGPQRCPACTQVVYHAEQVLAIGKKWHKRCLRCTTCSKALDSSLAERAGKPYCTKCYDQHFGTGSHGFVLRAGFVGK